MKKKKRILLLIIIAIFLIIGLYVYNRVSIKEINLQLMDENVRKEIYGTPIEIETGMINNEYFGINNSGKDAENTTRGLNEAIDYAYKHNLTNIKLKKGKYLVNGEGTSTDKKGILLKPNIKLDLNNSTIVHETNGSIRYSIFSIYDVENVVIYNGTIIGDKRTHDYDTIDSTHEWGFGIEIKGSKNVTIKNLEIKELTGDGIVVAYYNNNGEMKNSEDIQIFDNQIHECRRQGITIGNSKGVKVYQNEIYDILGTLPAATIDIEPDFSIELAEDIEIFNNKLYSKYNYLNAIQMVKYIKNINVHDNDIKGNIVIYGSKDKIKIDNNNISYGNMDFKMVKETRNNPEFLNKIEMTGNKIDNCNFYIEHVNNIFISKNQIKKTEINITSSNLAIANNEFLNLKNEKYISSFNIDEGENQNYNLYLYQNTLPENTEDFLIDNENIHIFYDEKSYNNYVTKEFYD